MTDTPSFDEIPVLTEVVVKQAPAAEAAPVAEPEAGEAAPPEAVPVPVLEPAIAESSQDQSGAIDDDAWRTLEERLVTRVLDRLQPRIDVVLEDQVRGQMAIVLDHVAERLGVELRAALQQSIEHVVARAVEQELAHLTARQS
jgi:hypothetical protein